MKHLLVYDSACGVCVRFRRLVGFLDPRGSLGFVSLKEAEQRGQLDRVPRAARGSSFHLISPDGGVESGAEAIPSLLGILSSVRLASVALSALPWVQRYIAAAYDILSRLHQAEPCRTRRSRT